MFCLLMTAQPTLSQMESDLQKFSYSDVTSFFGKWLLIFACILIPITIFLVIKEVVERKRAGLPAREKPSGAERLVAGAKALLALKVILMLLFFPFFIIWAGVRGSGKGR